MSSEQSKAEQRQVRCAVKSQLHRIRRRKEEEKKCDMVPEQKLRAMQPAWEAISTGSGH